MPTEANYLRQAECLQQLSMAGFQVTMYGRIWVTAEDLCSDEEFEPCRHEAYELLDREGCRSARKYVALMVATFRNRVRKEAESDEN